MSPDTRSIILQEAEVLIRTRGYAAFSYADLATRAEITKAGVHHYFPTKEDLIGVLLREYLERFVAALAGVKQQHAAAGDRLRAYAQFFLDGFEKGMLPLCGALSAERSALPVAMHAQIEGFFRLHLDWLAGVLSEGVASGGLRADIAIEQVSLLLLSTLEGGTFVGWALGRKTSVLAAFEAALQNIEASGTVHHPKRSPAS